MGKSFLREAPEQKGSVPACTGALLQIKEIERTKTKIKEGKKAKKMYAVTFEILEPKSLKGMQIRDWLVVGTEDDPLAKEEETWARSEGGPGRLARLLNRANVEIDDDDDQAWMDAAPDGDPVVAPILARADRDSGEMRSSPGLYFAPSDDDCPEVGLAEEGESKGRGGKGAAAAGKKARGRHVEEEEEEETPKKGKKKVEEEEEEEAPKKKKRVVEEEEEEEAPKRKKRRASEDD